MRKRKTTISGPSLLVTYRRRVILLERQVARLLAASPYREQEKYIAMLEARVIDCEARWEEAESENYALRKALTYRLPQRQLLHTKHFPSMKG